MVIFGIVHGAGRFSASLKACFGAGVAHVTVLFPLTSDQESTQLLLKARESDLAPFCFPSSVYGMTVISSPTPPPRALVLSHP